MEHIPRKGFAPIRLAIYGTLRPGYGLHGWLLDMIAQTGCRISSSYEGWLRGCIHRPTGDRGVPFLTLPERVQPGDTVKDNKVWVAELAEGEGNLTRFMRALDSLEGAYDRRLVDVKLADGSTVSAFTYEYRGKVDYARQS